MQIIRYPSYLFGKIWALAFIFVGGGILAATVLPILAVLPGRKYKAAQYAIHKSFRFYIRALQFTRLIDLNVVGAEKFADIKGKIVISNHPTLLDVVIFMALIPDVQCIVKHELFDSFLLRGLMRRAGYIRNDLEPEKLIACCKASLDEGRNLIIFPEGTRTLPGTSPRFHRGFANIATLTKAPVQVVLIRCRPDFLFKNEPWWHIPERTPFIQVTLGECLDASTYLGYGQRSIAARKLVESLEYYYAQQI